MGAGCLVSDVLALRGYFGGLAQTKPLQYYHKVTHLSITCCHLLDLAVEFSAFQLGRVGRTARLLDRVGLMFEFLSNTDAYVQTC